MKVINNLNKVVFLLSCMLGMAVQAITLPQAIQHAVRTNPDVLRALKECMASKEQWKGSYGNYFPSLDAHAGYGVERSDNASTRARGESHDTLARQELGLKARQMLFDGMATPNNVRRTRARADAFAWGVVAEANDVALRVAEAYLNVLRQQQLVELARENLQTHQRTAAMIERRSTSGISRETDAVQAKGRLAQASANLKAEEGHLKDAEIAFFRITGLNVSQLHMPVIPEQALPSSQNHAVNMALDRHPRLRSAHIDIVERLAQYKHSRSNFYPHVYAEFELNRNRHIDGVRGRHDDALAMLRAHWNLFRGGADVARKRETAYLAQEAAEIRNRTFRQLMENTSLVWVAYLNNQRLLEDLHKHTEAALATIDAYNKQFQLGERTLLDLLNSQNEHFSSKRLYINTHYDCMLAKLRLLNSTGQLLSFFKVDMDRLGPGYENLNHLLQLPAYRPKESRFVDTGPKALPTAAAVKVQPNVGPYTIQVLATTQEGALQQFIKAHTFNHPVTYYQGKRHGKDWFELVYGEYPTLQEAQAAMKQLAPELRRHGPWIRPMSAFNDPKWSSH